jgi:ferredoxin
MKFSTFTTQTDKKIEIMHFPIKYFPRSFVFIGRRVFIILKKMTTYTIIASLLLLITVLYYFRNKRAKSKVIRVINDNCTGCQRCLKACHHKALEVVNGESGQRVVLKHPEKCTACRDCIMVCKFNALELANRKL